MGTATPVIDVNLFKPGHCHQPDVTCEAAGCMSAPVLIPCRLPESFTCEVVLGRCDCSHRRSFQTTGKHDDSCPARPVRVSASITSPDGSWEKSEVTDCETDARLADLGFSTGEMLRLDAAARARWPLVKALVLGHTDLSALLTGPKAAELLTQRDAVYAALADVVRHEEGLFQSGNDAMKAIDGSSYARPKPIDRECAATLERYMKRLIEQVGVLS
jgi:hypothetical protein